MKDTNQQSNPSSGASTPFFARFLEDQHAAASAPTKANVTMKYPSDRDEGDIGLNVPAEAAPTKANVTMKYPSDRDEGDIGFNVPAQAGPSRATLKYPSDRDEIDNYSAIDADAPQAKAGPSGMTLKYPSDRDEIDPHC